MLEQEEPDLDEIATINARAMEKAREIANDFKAVAEHEILIDAEIPKVFEINPSLPKRR